MEWLASERRFSFRFAFPYRLAGRVFGITTGNCGATIDEERLSVRYAFPKTAGIEPTGLLRHPDLTLTLADTEAFVASVRAGKR